MDVLPPQRPGASDNSEPPPRRLIGISLLPAAATLGNLVCGFLALFACLLAVRAAYGELYADTPRVSPRLGGLFPTHISLGAYLIVLAMVFDALDGRLARMTRRTSEFGAQLDSIADIVSFGVAPAALFVTMLLRPVLNSPAGGPDVSGIQFRVGLTAALIYVACTAIRLARFNAENVKSESGQKKFSGLPSPGAAAALVSLVALHEHLREYGVAVWGLDWADISRWVIALTAFGVGLLMVSRLDYLHVFNVYVRRKHPPSHLIWLIGIVALALYSFELLLVLAAFAYVVSGLVLNILAHWRGRGKRTAHGHGRGGEREPRPALPAEEH